MPPVDPGAPTPFQAFLIMTALAALGVGVILFFAACTRGIQRLRGITPEPIRPQCSTTRPPLAHSKGSVKSFKLVNNGQQVSPQQNAQNGNHSGVQAVSERSNVQPPAIGKTLPIALLPTSPDEMHKLAFAIVLYAKRPNKQLAIKEAWACTKGAGEEWQRGLALFDAAMEGPALAAAKAKPDATKPADKQREIQTA